MNLYNQQYFKDLEKALPSELPRNRRILDSIELIVPPGKLLDIGIGTGLFLSLAVKNGWQAYGLDVSSYAVDHLRTRLKGQLIKGKLKKGLFKDKFFDVVNMRHSLEHIQNPKIVLEIIYQLLKPGGILSIAVPNSFGLHAKVYGQSWPHWSKPYHLNYYSKNSLVGLLKKTGFSIITVRTEEITIYDFLKYLIYRLTSLPLNYRKPCWLSQTVDKFLAWIGLGEGIIVLAKKPRR